MRPRLLITLNSSAASYQGPDGPIPRSRTIEEKTHVGSTSMDRAARSLGETEGGAVRRVHAPLVKGALWTAGLLIFVDVLKELPATLMLRPFNFDTLAVLADRYAGAERLGPAAWPALLIVLTALAPTIWLSRKVMASRPGERS